ncbi:A/G-specific adenine glycosylase [Myxococcota bacterium]|nr:A/G-specific adenine glycosylase [Myxococcota bacterium]
MHDAKALRARLVDWYRANRRALPWRSTRDPYAVWISEIMLQQTRVETVIPYFERFVERWPTVAALAAADPADVRAAWSGLGYYRRAQLMLDAAASVVRDHGGALPGELEALRALPGFGRYTAGAVASIGFGIPAAAVDGNVARVLARLHAIEGDVTKGAPNAELWAKAEALATARPARTRTARTRAASDAGDLTQALIELGALVCTPKSPRCTECPVSDVCLALRAGKTDRIPPPKKRAARTTVEVTAVLLHDDARHTVILERQPSSGLFAELWCLPMLEGTLEPDAVADEAARARSWSIDQVELAAEVKHVLTHRDIVMRIVRARGRPPETEHLRALPLDALDRHGVPSMTVRALRAALPRSVLSRAKLPGRTTKRAKAPTTLPLFRA